MKVRIEPEAEEDLKQFGKEDQRYIRDRLLELEKRPTGHEDSDVIMVGGRQVLKYVMKSGTRGGRDYRAVYDIREGKIRVAAIFHRDEGYDKDEIEDRI